MAIGGKRPGAGAPKGNRHTVKHGIYSKTIVDKETLEAFNRHYAQLKKDPVDALLADAALITAHVERVLRHQDEDGFFCAEIVDSTGPKGATTTRRLEVTDPIARALYLKGRLTLIAHEVEAKRRGLDLDGQDTVIRVVIPVLSVKDPE